MIKDDSIKLVNTKRQFIEAKANRIPEDNNSLTLMIKKTDLKTNKTLIAKIICDDYEVTTDPTPGSIGLWEESFNFNPLSDLLKVEIWESDKTRPVNKLGSCDIIKKTLLDQEIHENWLSIINENKEIGKLLLSAQFIINRVEYLEKNLNVLEKTLTEKRANLDELEKKYDEFLLPFNVNSPQWFMTSPRLKIAELELSKQLDDFTVKTFGKEVKWPVAMKISIHLYMLLSVCNMLYRPDFFNVLSI